MPVTLTVNGRSHVADRDPDESLLAALREGFGLTGPKYGCGEGHCGACTVLVGGRPVRACVTRLAAAAGKSIVTIEGIADGERLHAVQEAFLEVEAFQCGYCTSGMVLASVALLTSTPQPTDSQIVRALDGHVCRCGTYPRIMRAVRLAAQRLAVPSAGGQP